MQELVSVIMPVHNAEKYLNESIQSVISQTYQTWELLIVNDGSSDNSKSIIDGFVKSDNRIRYFETDSPSGSPALPRNIGIKNAQGCFIAFLDSDDVWLPNKLECQLHLFSEYEDMAIGFSDYEKIDENGVRNERIVKSPAIATYRQLMYGNVIGCLTAIYDVRKLGKVFFPLIPHEDYALWLSILKKGYVARNTGVVSALYRVRNHSVSSNKWRVIFWQWNIYVNVERIGYLKAAYYFVHYAVKAFIKNRK